MHSALTPSSPAACRDGEGGGKDVCVVVGGYRVREDGDEEEEGDFCPQPVSLCVWRLFKKGSFVFKKSSCLLHYLLSAM